MTKSIHFNEEPKKVRDSLLNAIELAKEIHRLENELVSSLQEIDQHRYFVRIGFYSLRGFCVGCLKFSKTQGQRIVTQVRRNSTQADDGQPRA